MNTNRVNWYMLVLQAGGILAIAAGIILVLASTPGYADVVSQGDVIGGALIVVGLLMSLAWATAAAIVAGLATEPEPEPMRYQPPRFTDRPQTEGPVVPKPLFKVTHDPKPQL